MRKRVLPVFLITALALSACGAAGQNQQGKASGSHPEKIQQAAGKTSPKSLLVPLKDRNGKKVGQARLMQTPQGVKISLEASGLTPGMHGIHIHETGKCVPPDFESTGGHFNPFGKEHGLKNPKGPHAGDLPNITVGTDGTVQTTLLDKLVTLKKGAKNSLLDQDGSALVIHAGKDDNMSQPSGNSGKRVVCGEING